MSDKKKLKIIDVEDAATEGVPPAIKDKNQPNEQHSAEPVDAAAAIKSAVAAASTGRLELGRFRLTQDFGKEIGVKKVIKVVPLRKPTKYQFVQVHGTWVFMALVLNMKDDREMYVVDPALQDQLTAETTPMMLLPTITRQGSVLIWPIRMPRDDGRHDQWARTELEAANEARKSWVRIVANMDLGGYDVLKAVANLPDPEWPDISFDELLRIAFRDRLIESPDHPVLRRLRGEA